MQLEPRDTSAVAPGLPRVGVPARVVWGADDRFQKLRFGERLARDLGVAVDRIEGGKHFTREDHLDRIAAAIGDLLADVR
ncbi:MAG TPA: alpha/beta hydrolase [Actinomycetota bacterium]|nr:alpha/beta hydrolase [Actinomycetota bacterium]